MNSNTEENYLKTIYNLSLRMNDAVSTNAIAERLSTKAASVTDMLQRLSEKKLINYKKYQGVTLTPNGKKVAISIIRKHRLWEVFLVDKLNFKWDEVHDIAEQLEHIRSEELVERIDKFLNYPKFDPHGDPIPDIQGKFIQQKSQLLSNAVQGQTFIMVGVVDHSSSFLQHLDKLGLALGDEIKVKDKIEFDQSLMVTIKKKETVYLSHEVSRNLLVSLK
jgi:DtxR family Mn-dependent transcriptional regulator